MENQRYPGLSRMVVIGHGAEPWTTKEHPLGVPNCLTIGVDNEPYVVVDHCNEMPELYFRPSKEDLERFPALKTIQYKDGLVNCKEAASVALGFGSADWFYHTIAEWLDRTRDRTDLPKLVSKGKP